MRFLFDVGPDGTFAANARSLGIDIASADFVVLSHGHYDHGGGLETFYGLNVRAPVYAARGAFDHRTMHKGLRDRPVGIKPACFRPDRVIFADEDRRIAPGIDLVFARRRPGFIPRANRGARQAAPGGSGAPDGSMRPDTFDHEISLLLREDGKTCLISGCSHSGVTNIADAALARMASDAGDPAVPGAPAPAIDAAIGGMHLFHSIWTWPFWKRDVRALGRQLALLPVRTWHTGHCTLDSGYGVLSGTPGLDIRRFTTGTIITP